MLGYIPGARIWASGTGGGDADSSVGWTSGTGDGGRSGGSVNGA